MINYAELLANALRGGNGNVNQQAVEKPHFDVDKLSVKDVRGFIAQGKRVPVNVEKVNERFGHKIATAKCVQVAMTSNGMPQYNADGTLALRNQIVLTFEDDYPDERLAAWEGNPKGEVAPERDLNVENLHLFFAEYFDPDTNKKEVATTFENGKYRPTIYCLDSEPKARD